MTSSLLAQQPTQNTEADVLKVHAARNQALLAQDVGALEEILASELIWVHSSATIENRAEFLERVRSGSSRWLKLESHETRARVYGTVAIVSGYLHQTTTGPGREPADRALYVVEVYVWGGGQWRLTHFQAVADPKRALG